MRAARRRGNASSFAKATADKTARRRRWTRLRKEGLRYKLRVTIIRLMAAHWQSFLDNLEAAGWRVKCKERERFDKVQWKGEASKRGKRITATGPTQEVVLRRLWEICSTSGP